jgi:RNA polymerase sigma-70 factor, ECF subfamily
MKTGNYQEYELIEKFKKGNAAAFEQIYNRYHTMIFLLALQYLPADEDAKDIRSKSFIRLWELREKLAFDSMAALYSWLRSTTRNSCIDYLRSLSIRESKRDEIIKRYQEENHAEVFEASDKEALILDRLLYHIEQLPPKFKVVFKLRWLDDLKFREIAERLNTDISTIKKRYSRAVELLKEKIPGTELVILFIVFLETTNH